ncbi:MAG: NDP-sugar synthase [Nitrospinae bacterium]|nr:NDP-sugar synthase [Nitrospinota bacterium]
MNAMILAAGLGTRLLPHTLKRPKPLFPVLERDLLRIAVETVLKLNPHKIVINAHHLAPMIEERVAKMDYGVEIIVSRETEILGTAGGIKNAQRWLDSDNFAVLNSDVIMEPDWANLMAAHEKSGAVATLALRKNPDPVKYGPLAVNGQGLITRYLSATGPGHDGSAGLLMFTGCSILSPSIFQGIPAGRAVDISKEVYMPMTMMGEGLYGVAMETPWTDVGTAQDYHKTVMGLLDRRESSRDAGINMEPGARIIPPVYLEPGAQIGANAIIGPSAAIHAGAVIGDGAQVKNSVVLPGSSLPSGAVADGVIV